MAIAAQETASMLNTLTLEQAATLLDACPLAILLLDASGSIRACNREFTSLTGVVSGMGATEPEELRKEGLLEPLLGSDTLVNWIMHDGDSRWLAVESRPLAGPDGGTARFYVDVTEKLRLRKERDGLRAELKQLSLKDETLTGLMNRRGLLHALEPLVARCRRYDRPLSVIAMGLGTQEEQQALLVKISYLLRDQTRWADLIGCNDAHDFLIILQETTRESALRLIEKLTAQLKHISASASSPAIASYGVTQCHNDDDAEALLERAEAALGEASKQLTGTVISR
jgi:diguanylate cyclase (GGDEF)-like protein